MQKKKPQHHFQVKFHYMDHGLFRQHTSIFQREIRHQSSAQQHCTWNPSISFIHYTLTDLPCVPNAVPARLCGMDGRHRGIESCMAFKKKRQRLAFSWNVRSVKRNIQRQKAILGMEMRIGDFAFRPPILCSRRIGNTGKCRVSERAH